LADENHAEEKKEALHTLWQQAGEQKVPRGMQQSHRCTFLRVANEYSLCPNNSMIC